MTVPKPTDHSATETSTLVAGDVDAVVLSTPEGDQLFTVTGSDNPYRRFVEAMAEGAMTVSAQGMILSANPRMLDIAQLSLSEFVGAPVKKFFAEESPESLDALLSNETATGASVEMTLRAGDDSDVAVALTASPLDLDGLRVTCVLVTDISDRKAAQESEHLHATLLAAAGEAVIVTDPEGRITFVNRATEVLYGWDSVDLLGRLVLDALPTQQGPDEPSIFDTVRSGPAWSGEFVVRHRAGNWIPVFGSITPVTDGDGELLATIALAADVTERRAAEHALEANERWFRSLLQHLSDIIVVVDAEGILRYCSPSGLSVLGYEPDKLIGQSLATFIHPEDLPAKREAIANALELPLGGVAPLVQFRALHASGEWRWLETVGTNLLGDDAVHGLVINGRDVTENVLLARSLQTLSRANQVLVRADSESLLLNNLCLTLQESGYALSWVGFVEVASDYAVPTTRMGEAPVEVLDSRRTIKVVAAAGKTSYLAEQGVIWADDAYRSGPMAAAFRTGTTQIVGEIRDAPDCYPWRMRAEANGFRSACLLPLWSDGLVVGAVNIYSFQPDAFDAKSSQILEELAANLAYGLSRLRERKLLGEREKLLREAERLAHVGHWRWTPSSGRVEFLAEGIFEIYGVAREEWPATLAALLDFVPPAERVEVLAALARAATGELEVWDNAVVRADGSRRQVRTSTTVTRDSGGLIETVVGACLDYTEQAASTKNLRFQAQLLDNAGQAIVACDNVGVVTYWNRAAEALLGWTPAEAMGCSLADVMPSEPTVEQTAAMMATLEAGGSWHGELVVRRRDDAAIHMSVTDTPSLDEAGLTVGLIRVASDMSERRALESRLSQAQRLESLGLLAGGVAHDFNNLLTVILNCAMFIERDGAQDVRERAHSVVTAAEAAARLTRQLLTFARREPTHPAELELSQVVADTQELIARTVGDHIRLQVRCGEPATVIVDRSQLEQVLVNLAINACDAMPRGGLLVIETGVVELDDVYAKMHPDVAVRTYGRIVVRDTGVGMSPDVLAHAFDPFFSTRAREGGTGLGLATVYGIAKEAGGHVELYSEVGVGTVVQVYLPLLGDHVTAQPVPVEYESPVRPGATILIVEDKDLVREVACEVVRGSGYLVLEAATPAEAIALAKEHSIDLLVTDVMMPDMSGPALAELLVAKNHGLPVVFMSGYSADFLGSRGNLDDGVTLVQKPFTESTLLHAIRESLKSGASRASSDTESVAGRLSESRESSGYGSSS